MRQDGILLTTFVPVLVAVFVGGMDARTAEELLR